MEEKSIENPMIYERMAAVMKDVRAIGKNEKNQQQGFKFRGIDSVMNELHDIFAEHEIFVLPETLDFTTENRINARGTGMTFVRARIRFRYTTTDGSHVDTVNVGEAMDSGDKAMNKAMSIALKYSLLQMLLIPTEEDKDPDKYSEETDYIATAKEKSKKIITMAQLCDADFSAKFCAWLWKKEAETRQAGGTFKMANVVDAAYRVGEQERQKIIEEYCEYKVNNNLN